MTQNVQITPGTGAAIAADLITGDPSLGTADVQFVKLMDGTIGGTNKAPVSSKGLVIDNTTLGDPSDASWSGSGNMTLPAGIKKMIAQLASGLNLVGSVVIAAGSSFIGAVGGVTANPTATYTRPANTTAYTASNLVANSTTAGSVVVQTLTVARVAAGSVIIDRLRLNSNHTTGLAAINFKARLWAAPPTYTNGDGGAYAVATGAAGYLGSFTGAFEQFADGACAFLLPDTGSPAIALAAGQVVYVDLMNLDAFTPQSGKTFTITAECKQD